MHIVLDGKMADHLRYVRCSVANPCHPGSNRKMANYLMGFLNCLWTAKENAEFKIRSSTSLPPPGPRSPSIKKSIAETKHPFGDSVWFGGEGKLSSRMYVRLPWMHSLFRADLLLRKSKYHSRDILDFCTSKGGPEVASLIPTHCIWICMCNIGSVPQARIAVLPNEISKALSAASLVALRFWGASVT